MGNEDNARQETAGAGCGIFADDREYLEAYFEICELLSQKRSLLAKVDGSESRSSKPLSHDDRKRLDEKIAELNGRTRELDAAFWEKARRSVDAGRKYAAEEMSKHYGLDGFERRVFVYYLYLEFCQIGKNVCSEDELLGIFDLESSVISRMRDMRHFNGDRPLLKSRILLREFKRVQISAKAEYALSNEAIMVFSRLVNGESPGWQSTVALESDDDIAEIGYVKNPECVFDDVVLESETKERVALFLDALKDDALGRLGVSGKIKKGTGLSFLFYGPPGTGKSMLAEAIAAYLGKKMLIVEASKIMGRWLGDTEKSIATIFSEAKEHDLVVVIDEADSLLYDRSYAGQEHDIRFVNIMLLELERCPGVAVLTTNMDVLLDPALERRLSLKIKFETPEKQMLAEIWKKHMPNGIEVSGDVDFGRLAKGYDFSGGNVKNAVLNAVRRAGSRKDTVLTMQDFVFGADLEMEGMFRRKREKRIYGFSGRY